MFGNLKAGWRNYVRICRLLPRRFVLNHDVYFIKGAKRAAIYDLNVGTVYSVDSTGAQVLDLALQGLSPLEIACRAPVGLGDLVAFLDSLVLKHGVGHWYEGVEARAPSTTVTCAPLQLKFHSLDLELTQRCNLQCIHCYTESGPTLGDEALGREDWRQLIRDAALLGCRHVTFTGGEPLLAKELLLELIPYASERGLHCTVATNATLITTEIRELFYRFGVGVSVSLYGQNEQVHDRITQVVGSFKVTVDNVLYLRMRGVPVRITMAVMRENQDYLEETEQFVRDRLDAEFVAAPILPIGRGSSNKLVVSTDSFLHEASEKLIWAANKGRVQLPVRIRPIFPRVYQANFVARLSGTCWSGRLSITSTGDAIPCPAARQLILGNVKRSSLKTIIFSDAAEQVWKLTKDHVKVCKDCEYRYACQDCPVAVLARGGSLYEKPPWCTYDPYVGEWQSNTLTQLSDRTGRVMTRCLSPCPADGERS